jgi:hypothetical protein
MGSFVGVKRENWETGEAKFEISEGIGISL